ncbi:osmoprotectant transport system ATP-binding protein [Dehalogenimonas formicexedens]|uniref:ABC-type quaternary amine transporter n=1 Tax=Dehalogenimonas formicexedens TaxID=1839801 RepID=A0A1P8F8E3_9CHLR|nr:ABC transporter ATP-binding protein [Dehalogenimonas formicexedens]APV44725.1 osmoprotectant transport system ATP-binding protein [Dehalogenimonas formicexedens]
MIELERLTKNYGDTRAVANVTLQIPDGQVTVLIGPSGCGKTTLLRLINRLVRPSSGRILINGKDNSDFKPEELRRGIGYAIQGVGLFPHWTVYENIATVPKLLGWDRQRIRQRVMELLDLIGLDATEFSDRYPAELSGGQAQRVGVARALAADPPVLLMDEPFGAVDPLTRIRLQNQFLNIQDEVKKTVIFVTHDLEEAIRLADCLAIMNAGEIVQYNTPEEVLAQPKNKFVHDFVGTDRALKRLTRFMVKDYLKQGLTVKESDIGRLDTNDERFYWVIDSLDRFRGWVDLSMVPPGGDASGEIVKPGSDIVLTGDDTMRQALSIMLGQGVRSLPVVDKNGKFVGEVTLADIEKATADGKITAA